MNRRAFLATTAATAVAMTATPSVGETRTAHAFSFTDIDGAPMPLSGYAGKALLVVNTASRCGFTDQYAGLQALWETYQARGLVVIGVPSDAFNQELSTDSAVRDFCKMNYSIDFPLTEITEIRGPRAHPFYAWAAESLGPANAPRWNFHKYLIDTDGRAAAAFGTGVEPTSPAIVGAVEKLLPGGA